LSKENFVKRERKKLREIPGVQDKLLYIWDYYKLWIIGILAAIVVVIYLVTQLDSTRAQYWYYMMIANTVEDVGTGSRLWRDFEEYAGYDLDEKNMVFNNQIYFDGTEEEWNAVEKEDTFLYAVHFLREDGKVIVY